MPRFRPNNGVIGPYQSLSATAYGVSNATAIQQAQTTGGPLAGYTVAYLIVAGGASGAKGTPGVCYGAGGGGNGAANGGTPTSGTANTGGGGGGMRGDDAPVAGSGGSGIVIISYAGSQRGSGGTITSVGGNTIHTFTTAGTFTFTS